MTEFDEYNRVGALSDRAGDEYDRWTRREEIGRAIGVSDVNQRALTAMRTTAHRRWARTSQLRIAAYNAWRAAR